MLQHLRSVLRLGTGDGEPALLVGEMVGPEVVASLMAMCADRPSARKQGSAMLVVAPAAPEVWTGWVFDELPAVTELPDLIARVAGLSRAMVGQGPAAPSATPAGLDAVALLAGRFAAAGRLRRSGVLQALADGAPETGLAAAAAVFPVTAGRVGRPIFSNRDLETASDEIRALATRLRASGETRHTARADDLGEDKLDSALVLSSVGHASLFLDVPPSGEAGLGFAFFDPSHGAADDVGPLRDLAHLAMRRRRGKAPTGARRYRQASTLAALLTLAVWLAWPVPRVITATGLSRPAEAVVVALHYDAFLEDMAVSVGATVAEGDLIARFNAPALEERRAEAALQILVEEVTAQTALAQNDYGAFVLSEQRIASLQRRLDNLDARLAGLSLRAPVGGRVVSAMGGGRLGAFVAAGEEVALLQEEPRFALTLEFLRVDAPLIQPGQEGEVYFRGISGESFPFTITTPVLVERNHSTGEERLTARATLSGGNQDRLLTGLSGYGRILSDPAPRGLNFARYAIEYVKVRAWSYLGLRL